MIMGLCSNRFLPSRVKISCVRRCYRESSRVDRDSDGFRVACPILAHIVNYGEQDGDSNCQRVNLDGGDGSGVLTAVADYPAPGQKRSR